MPTSNQESVENWWFAYALSGIKIPYAEKASVRIGDRKDKERLPLASTLKAPVHQRGACSVPGSVTAWQQVGFLPRRSTSVLKLRAYQYAGPI